MPINARRQLSLTLLLCASTAFQSTTFIDVGQGDAALLRDGEGFDVLIDGGKTSAGPTVLAVLRSLGITELDVMVASHADADHIGGLIDVLEADDIVIQQVLYNGYPGSTVTWSNFAAAVAADGLALTPAQSPMELQRGEMRASDLICLFPHFALYLSPLWFQYKPDPSSLLPELQFPDACKDILDRKRQCFERPPLGSTQKKTPDYCC